MTLPQITAGLIRTSTTALRRIPQQFPAVAKSRAFSSTAPQNRHAIVTGGARGIGKAIALRLARDGYDVTVNDVSEQNLGFTLSEIEALGRRAYGHVADVSQQDAVANLIKASVRELGPLDTMVANAGIAQVKPLLDLTTDDFSRMMNVNVGGVHYCYQAAAKQMIEQGTPGKLIGAASIVAFKPFVLLGHYSASKWAVRGLTQVYAMELAEHKITVNAYAPGIVDTGMWELIDEGLAKKAGRKKGEMISKYSSELIALGRTSVPEDVANLVGFMASKDADYITGQTYVVDGGIIFT
ncbi:3-oxoacyl-reductase [Diplogelasinospora grovesii]|uniref:3-oxoacyl-reductase n=1 Tax=Diplogelasinospora grovesii TaxID=303347 RepID=A0AAN6NEZ1_9PEZI|nr:3-oxoacyl-reductase [Diplogelasinospora grovesii]